MLHNKATTEDLSDDPTLRMAKLYSALAEPYAQLWSPVIRPMALPLLHNLHLQSAERILDLGTGIGALLPDIRAAAPNSMIVGVDRSEGMLRLAEPLRSRFDISLALMDAQHMGFRSSSFDVTILAFMLFHVSQPPLALAEVARVLRPGAAIGTVTWGGSTAFPASDVWDEELDAHGANRDPVDTVRHDDTMDTPVKIRDLLEEAHFSKVRAWTSAFQHQWDLESFFALRLSYGVHRRRLDTLEPDVRSACLACIRERQTKMSAADFIFGPEVVFAVAERAASNTPPGHSVPRVQV
jgi:SAM-dependent methyltransferase